MHENNSKVIETSYILQTAYGRCYVIPVLDMLNTILAYSVLEYIGVVQMRSDLSSL